MFPLGTKPTHVQGGGSDTASTVTAGGGDNGLGGSPVVLAAEGLVQAVQPLLTSGHESEAGNGGGSGGNSPGSEHRNRRGYRSDPDEPSMLAPAGTDTIEMGGTGAGGGAGGALAGAVGAVASGVKRTVQAGVREGVRTGQSLGRQLRPGQGQGQGQHLPEISDIEQGYDIDDGGGAGGEGVAAGPQATHGSVYEGLRRDAQSAFGGRGGLR